jgi:sugar lactone lactonase YvrE
MKRCGVVAATIGAAFGVVAFGVLANVIAAAPAGAWDRGDADILTVLPVGTTGQPTSVEGLTVGPDGNIYVPSFGFNAAGAISGNATLFVIRPDGQLVRKVAIANSSPHVLGLRFNPVNSFLLVLDFGAGTVLHVDPVTGASSVLMTAPVVTPGVSSALNALTFDKLGNAYISDSFDGVIWKIGPMGGTPTVWSNSPLLGPGTGLTPPFGANGIEFTNDGKTVLVANTAFHQIIQIPVNPDGSAGTASIFITGINAPDGIALDRDDNIWICANQEDDIIVIDKTGKVIAKLGDFGGIDEHGVARGFFFPASLAFGLDGKTLYVSNLELYLPYAGAHAAVDSPYALQVKHFTVSKVRAVIPPLGDDDEH